MNDYLRTREHAWIDDETNDEWESRRKLSLMHMDSFGWKEGYQEIQHCLRGAVMRTERHLKLKRMMHLHRWQLVRCSKGAWLSILTARRSYSQTNLWSKTWLLSQLSQVKYVIWKERFIFATMEFHYYMGVLPSNSRSCNSRRKFLTVSCLGPWIPYLS